MKRNSFFIGCFRFLRSLFSPAVIFFSLTLLLFAFLSGYLFTPPEKKENLSEEEEYRLLEDALLDMQRSVAKAPTEEAKRPFREGVFFYKTAMEEKIPVWSSSFYSEVLHRLSILLASPEKTDQTEKEIKSLKEILEKEDREGFVFYLEEKMRQSGNFSEKEIALHRDQNFLIFSKDNPESAGREELLEDIFLLRESLLEGKNKFHLAEKEAKFDERKAQKLKTLMNFKIDQYESGRFLSTPANDQTLRSSESFLVLLFALVFLFAAAKKEKEEEKSPLSVKIVSYLLFSVLHVVLIAFVLIFSARHFSADTAIPLILLSRKSFFSIPFALGVFLRLLLRALPYLPFFLFFFAEKKNARPAALGILSWYLFGVFAPFFGKVGIQIGQVFFLADSVFPSPSRFTLLPPSPLWSVAVLLLLSAIPMFLILKSKKRKDV